ncbi:MAG: hypothetical protein LBD94_03530 [Rickettsiales bacterium]|jgi:hypothetical protein|nr:hypothetical protein [Rickettsiales bacterium]
MAKKEVKFIERNGEKFVARKKSWVAMVKIVFMSLTILWFALSAYIPLYVKNTYSEPIKKSIVVSMFFDLQQGIADQYSRLMDGIKKSINLEKPINKAIEKVKVASKPVSAVQKTTGDAKKLTGFASKLGVKVNAVDNIVNKVDDTATIVNAQLDKVEKELLKVGQTEVEAMVDEAVRNQLDKATGGMSKVLLEKYNVKSIAPWRPSTWSVSNKIYAEIEHSSKSTVQIIMNTINGYFGYVAWGLVLIAWAAALLLWFMAFKKVKMIIKPFVVCPNCGHAFADKRTAWGLLKILQPWKWL